MKNKFTPCFIFFLFIAFASAQMDTDKLNLVGIPGTQLLKINSSIVEQEYDLYIHLPRFYEDTARKFPVVYLLDAQWDFPLLTAIWGEQYYDGFVPELIIVGITWGGKNPDYDGLRRRDFTPAETEQTPYSGGASKFLSFIKEELIPFIDSQFRTDKNDRVLIGSSLGGLFTLYTLFNEPELFSKYVLTSPALGWENEIVYSYERKYSEAKGNNNAKLFMAIGEYEDVGNFMKFADLLQKKDYKKLLLKSRVLDGIGHSGTKAEGFTRGLQFVFEKSPLSSDPKILEQFTGTYRAESEIEINITKDGDILTARYSENEKLILYPESENDFYVKGQYFFIHFNKNENGKVTGLQLERFNGEILADKIE